MGVLNRVSINESLLPSRNEWYLKIPAIAAVRASGLELDPRVTVIVGENGSGKSTFIEALAHSWGSRLRSAVKHWGPARSNEDASLHQGLVLEGDLPWPHGGCFLRAEAMHGLFTAVDLSPGAGRAFDGPLNARSHGEGFLAYLESRLSERGLFILDEPEAALSFTSCLQLLSVLGGIADSGSQVVLATHSPVLAAFPGALLLEFGDHGVAPVIWEELALVDHWRSFMARPDSYLRHLFS
jgi:predicted ATPase